MPDSFVMILYIFSCVDLKMKMANFSIRTVYFIMLSMLLACSTEQEDIYTNNFISYPLIAGSEYDFEGVANVRELRKGGVELELILSGEKTTEPYFYPAHLHFGPYDSPDAPMAQMLSPVDARTLESKTVINQLHDGSSMDFIRFSTLDGHIKVHLAEDGPDYNTILVVGNVGVNADMSINLEKMTMCSPYSY